VAEADAVPDRRRAIYAGPWRIDITTRGGTPRLVPDAALAGAIAAALDVAQAPKPAAVGLVLTDDDELASLNLEHMAERGPTDVLSFPMLPAEAFRGAKRGRANSFALPPRSRQSLGDIVVSVERAVDQAERGRGGQTGDVRWSPADELRLLVTHGALHLCGWDHAEPNDEAEMRAVEQRLLRDARRPAGARARRRSQH
jgi:probable rRNA maturation factor